MQKISQTADNYRMGLLLAGVGIFVCILGVILNIDLFKHSN